MATTRDNAIRVKRFRELKATLLAHRQRLLVGLDIAKTQHVAHVRLAHTQLLDKQVMIPNTAAGFAAFWGHLQRCQRETGVAEIICVVEPTWIYHQALATFLEGHGVDVVLVANHVAHHNHQTLDGIWGKTDPKDAHNLCDLLERGHVLFFSLPDARTATLRRLVRLLRQARVELGACQARFRNTLLPLLGPTGEPLPAAVVATLPACLQRLCPAAASVGAGAGGAGPRCGHAPGGALRAHRPRRTAHRGAGADHAAQGGTGPGRGATPGLRVAPEYPRPRTHARRDPPGRDRRHRVVHHV